MSDLIAEKVLREHQQQLDADGVMVGVSRQALDEVLAALQTARDQLSACENEAAAWKADAAAEFLAHKATREVCEGALEPFGAIGARLGGYLSSCPDEKPYAPLATVLGDFRRAAAALTALRASPIPGGEDQREGWKDFTHGETALDFGSRYVFANPITREMGIYTAHQPPPAATHCIKLIDLLATIPPAAPASPSGTGGE